MWIWYVVILAVIVAHRVNINMIKSWGLPYSSEIIDTAARFGVPAILAIAQVKVESSFRRNAISIKGARGLMQIMPDALTDVNAHLGTAYTFDDMFDVQKNLIVGFTFLDMKRTQFGGLYNGYVAYYAGHAPSSQGTAYADSIYQAAKQF